MAGHRLFGHQGTLKPARPAQAPGQVRDLAKSHLVFALWLMTYPYHKAKLKLHMRDDKSFRRESGY
jgi:hypothetical protein